MLPAESFFDYAPGYYAAVMYNYDLKNDKIGMVFGVEYTNYGLAVKYKSPDSAFSMIQKHMVSRVSIPVYVKIGKGFYKKQNYLYIGMRYDRNILHYKTEEASGSSDIKIVNVSNDMLNNQNFTAILGLNYMFINVEANYVLGGFLNKDYTVYLYNNNKMIKPYENYPWGSLFISTGLTVPLNSWSSRQLYLFEMWFKRIFK